MSNARNLANIITGNYDIPSGALDNAIPADGSIAISKLDTSVTQLLGMKNLLINGDFRVWQRGTDLTSGISGNNGECSADRWRHQYVDMSPRSRKVSDTINGEYVDCLEMTRLGGTYSAAEITQKVESEVAKYLRGQTVTFSFWVKKVGSTFGSHNVSFWVGDSETVDDSGWTNQRTYDRGRSNGLNPAQTNTIITFTNNDWQKIVVTRTLSGDTNTIYCTIYTGSTPVDEGIRVAKCQLEVGSVATPFERRPYGLELSLCQRFYETLDTGEMTEQGNYYASYRYITPVRFAVKKRVTPTIITLSQGGWPNGGGGTYSVGASPERVGVTGVSGNALNNQLHAYVFSANAEF